jgi:hypothetical protein
MLPSSTGERAGHERENRCEMPTYVDTSHPEGWDDMRRVLRYLAAPVVGTLRVGDIEDGVTHDYRDGLAELARRLGLDASHGATAFCSIDVEGTVSVFFPDFIRVTLQRSHGYAPTRYGPIVVNLVGMVVLDVGDDQRQRYVYPNVGACSVALTNHRRSGEPLAKGGYRLA